MKIATRSNREAFHQGPVRPWTRVLPLCAALLLAACGDGNRIAADGAEPPLAAPTALSYEPEQALHMQGEAIAPHYARWSGGAVSSFSIDPALPEGLSLDEGSGIISGTPTTLQRQASYTVTARNAAGSAQAPLRLTVSGRGAWSALADITVPRFRGSLTRLGDGRLLYAGGFSGAMATGATELYDPATRTWTVAAPMLVPRFEAGAVLLADGRVLVFGGQAGGVALNSAELYDPMANTWTATGSLNQARTESSATLLPNGHVLATGGENAGVYTNTAERYDPATGTWFLLPALLAEPRAQHAAVLLPGGQRLLLVGGADGQGNQGTAELYAVDGTATTAVPFDGIASAFEAVGLDDGSVLVVGSESPVAWRFNPSTSSWVTSAPNSARRLPKLSALPDGRVLLTGGQTQSSTEIYNPDHNSWTLASPLAAARYQASSAVLADGSVLLVGGSLGGAALATVERFAP